MARTLLLVTYYFPPGSGAASFRSLGFARHLPSFGWNVKVVCADNVPWEPEQPELADSIPPGTQVIRVPYPKSTFAKIEDRFQKMTSWLRPAWSAVAETIERDRPDAIYTTSPPGCVHQLGQRAKLRWNLPWVACLRDPWITNIENYNRPPIFRAIEKAREARMLQTADLVLANTPLAQDGLRKVYPQYADKITYLTNGFDPDRFPTEIPQQSGKKKTLTLLHAGEFYNGRSPAALIAALAKFVKNPPQGVPPVRLKLLGGPGNVELDSMIAAHEMGSHVDAQGHVPYQVTLDSMTEADILVVIQFPGRHTAIPAKVYEYLGAGKPILVLAKPGGDIDWVLETVGVTHRIVEMTDEEKIYDAIVDLTRTVASGKARAADPEKLRQFTRASISEVLGQRLDALVAS